MTTTNNDHLTREQAVALIGYDGMAYAIGSRVALHPGTEVQA